MNRVIKGLCVALISGMMLFGIEAYAEEAKTVSVYTDGTQIDFDVEPQIINDRTMVPMRAIFEAIGAEVNWDDSTKTAVSEKDGDVVKISIGEYRIIKNDEEIAIDVPAQIVDSRTLVPVRAIAESFDCEVFWDDAERIVRVVTVKLPEPVLTAADETIVLKINDYEISQAEYALLSNVFSMIGTVSEEEILDYIKYYYAILTYADNNDIALVETDKDFINKGIYDLMTTEEYQSEIELLKTTDAAMMKFLYDSELIELAQSTFFDFADDLLLEYARSSYVRIKHILVETEEEAEEILSELKAGASFEELAKEKSLDNTDVEIGYIFGHDVMVEEVENAAYDLEEGEISDIVESFYGYHIIKRYPLSEISDEYLLENLYDEMLYDVNYAYYLNSLNEILDSMTVTKL